MRSALHLMCMPPLSGTKRMMRIKPAGMQCRMNCARRCRYSRSCLPLSVSRLSRARAGKRTTSSARWRRCAAETGMNVLLLQGTEIRFSWRMAELKFCWLTPRWADPLRMSMMKKRSLVRRAGNGQAYGRNQGLSALHHGRP